MRDSIRHTLDPFGRLNRFFPTRALLFSPGKKGCTAFIGSSVASAATEVSIARLRVHSSDLDTTGQDRLIRLGLAP